LFINRSRKLNLLEETQLHQQQFNFMTIHVFQVADKAFNPPSLNDKICKMIGGEHEVYVININLILNFIENLILNFIEK